MEDMSRWSKFIEDVLRDKHEDEEKRERVGRKGGKLCQQLNIQKNGIINRERSR